MLSSFSTADHARLSRLAALAACAVAGLVCIWLLVRLAWLLVPPEQDTAAAPAVAPSAAAAAQSVAKWHLFGNPRSVMLAQAMRAPTTTLKLTLRGTLSLPDAQQGIAMIEDEHGLEQAYKVGEQVAGVAKLAEVYADHVVLSHEGASETLNLPQPEAHAAADSASRNASAVAPANAAKGGVATPIFVPPQMAHGSLDWTKAQKELRLDPAQLARQVHIEPVLENGRISGARLSGGGDVMALMNQAGLKPTDTIAAVNGTTITGLPNPQQFMDNLKNASSLQVTVIRDGKPATLTLNLR